MLPLEHGSSGAAVADVQRRLVALGHRVDDDPGTFGTSTGLAVRMFQQERRLVADGVVGHETWTALVDAGHALGDRLLYLTRPMLRGDDVRELQRALSRLGFDTGSTDGIHGPLTDAALRDFQHNVGVEVDGIAGTATVAALRSLWRRHQAATSFEVLERHDPGPRLDGLVGFKVLVDPVGGPGRAEDVRDGGARHEVTFDIAQRLRGMLAANGALPTLTRSRSATPTSSERAQFANDTDQDLILSIACGSLPQSAARGVSAQYFGDGDVSSERGRRLAEVCVDEVVTATGTLDCQTHPSTSTILRESRAPAAIVEVGFITHPEEGALLLDPAYRHRIAGALFSAVRRWVVDGPEIDAAAATAQLVDSSSTT